METKTKYAALETLVALVEEIKQRFTTKTEINNYEFITIEDIDTICGAEIYAANEVMF